MKTEHDSKGCQALITPKALRRALPASEQIKNFVAAKRNQASNIIHGHNDRLLVLVGPCSIHDTKGALEYAERLKIQADQHKDELCLIMRTYFEKPRTRLGWGGLIHDPELNGTFKVNDGLHTARELLLKINTLGIPAGNEFLAPFSPHYLSDLVSWSAIGARTSESPIHRQLASGLELPVGFKNTTTGDIQAAIDAIQVAQTPQHYLGIDQDGQACLHSTTGNPNTHIILRGSTTSTNYDSLSISEAINQLKAAAAAPRLMVDCSHGNSQKNPRQQAEVAALLAEQIRLGNRDICGVMMESYLVEGRQEHQADEALTYGQSITDACMGWQATEKALAQLAEAVKSRREKPKQPSQPVAI